MICRLTLSGTFKVTMICRLTLSGTFKVAMICRLTLSEAFLGICLFKTKRTDKRSQFLV